jgi:methyl-accepting chemotaxis protein
MERMKSVGKSMEDIQRSNDEISKLKTVIENVQEKTSIINDIVFQTKLLSFNASVEAARAGEHGKGFAVVAEEVGNLASMSGKASAGIAEIVDGSVGTVQRISEENDRYVKECIENVRSTIDGSNEMSASSEQLLSSSEEQSRGVKGIESSLLEISRESEKTKQVANKTLEYSNGLKTESESLKKIMIELVTLLDGEEQKDSGLSLVYDRNFDKVA